MCHIEDSTLGFTVTTEIRGGCDLNRPIVVTVWVSTLNRDDDVDLAGAVASVDGKGELE